MPDICMCKGTGCAVKDFCFRHIAKPDPHWQSYFTKAPGEDQYCEHYAREGKKAPKRELSEAVFNALQIVRDNPGIVPARFADKMWPTSEGWKRPAKCGPSGSHRGGGMYLAAGGFLGRLYRQGLVQRSYGKYGRPHFYLSQTGSRALRWNLENRQGAG